MTGTSAEQSDQGLTCIIVKDLQNNIYFSYIVWSTPKTSSETIKLLLKLILIDYFYVEFRVSDYQHILGCKQPLRF